jgi:hypothetical protein
MMKSNPSFLILNPYYIYWRSDSYYLLVLILFYLFRPFIRRLPFDRLPWLISLSIR